jgi:N-methylhydantoinase A
VPSVDVHSVGAGGGSIAHVPMTGALRVGPESAGAVPGPACYGKGGDRPTVTDANVVLGRLPPRLLGGKMMLDTKAAEEAVAKIARALSLDLHQAAQGILDIVNENMLGALRLVTVQKGLDPRDFALVPSAVPGRSTATPWPRSPAAFRSSCRRRPACCRPWVSCIPT